jgi:uncharacterized protein (DUF58 family)
MFANALHAALQPLRKRLRKWAFPQRAPETGEVHLTQRRVYIVPSSPGFAWVLMLGLIFIGSINYNLSLGFGLTFLLAACGVVDMHLSFRNLAYLDLSPGRCPSVFAGEQATFEVHLANRRNYDRFAIWLNFDDPDTETPANTNADKRTDARQPANTANAPDDIHSSRPASAAHHPAQACDIAANDRTTVVLSTPAQRRGYLQAPRIRLQAHFPLGLLRTWAYWRPAMRVLVYPWPEVDAPALPHTGTSRANGRGNAGQDDFAGVRHYQAGDPLKHLAWRQIARLDPELGGQLVSKQFEGGGDSDLLLDFASLPTHLGLEEKLSRMTRWVLEAERLGAPYAFRLGSVEIDSANGEAHLHACLQALALYQLPEET